MFYTLLYIIRRTIRFLADKITTPEKLKSELAFWKELYTRRGYKFDNSWYINIMLPLSGECTINSFKDKVVADFGCGPLGSLEWIEDASELIGIDVLANEYIKSFDLSKHKMHYLANTETEIPLPDSSVDVLFTLNAMDHTKNFETMSRECLRILKPGGLFAGEFNLNGKQTICEPQVLNEDAVRKFILQYLDISLYRITKQGIKKNRSMYFFEDIDLIPGFSGPCILWARGRKKRNI